MRRNKHNLSHTRLATMDMGYLVPLSVMEVLAGDTVQHHTAMLARIAPLAAPLMHPVEIRVHNFFVPNRLIWDQWEDFITKKDPLAFVPQVTIGTSDETAVADTVGQSLADAMGIAPVAGESVNALPFRAYNFIWNEYYRDQDLQAEIDQDGLNGFNIQRIAWEKDYFTTARPFPQMGTEVSVPIDGMPVLGVKETLSGTTTAANYKWTDGSTGSKHAHNSFQDSGNGIYLADSSFQGGTGTGISVNELRQSFALQRMAEARARFGSRYVDYLRFLGVNPSNGMLDRPEYLGGGKTKISFSEVLAQAEGANTNVGDMFGHGIGALRTRRYRKFFEEHGWMISVMSVRPKTMYLNGIPRQFLRQEADDYWQKELEVLPTQGVLSKEVYAAAPQGEIFGYVPKYEEYRRHPSYVSGSFRTTENFWHMGRSFDQKPALNADFVNCTPTDRVYQDKSIPEVMVTANQHVIAYRPVRKNGAI